MNSNKRLVKCTKVRQVTHLTFHEVELVRQMRESGMTYSKIAEKMEIGKATAVDICHYRIRRYA
jgi:predicted DNA-binding protein (UPF0251 family)